MAYTSPRTWVAGETVTAALLNTHLRDNMKALGDAWTAYVPVWTATGTAPAIGNGTIVGSYVQFGKLVIYKIKMVLGSTSTMGTNTYSWSLPVTAINTGNEPAGSMLIVDASPAANYGIIAILASTTTVRGAQGGSGGGLVTATSPITPATSDTFNFSGTYEAA